ncbi:alpha/beta fold hydrolase [Thalassorhabdomicrobium marinisediminis]|uniref:Alpha/beta hydrolase n=1 Tax=Thalassorhabdomicrobium marinisediminis TaxID=2170577 RepID=A0A2T7FUK9_9RHOB|nr:alpha/beta hydrolase [Thalassorhabdomicrobium marinisediminis]PVA05849.1 alpha/beta hydrolase [Thalassorhabdomicrobium marinisediminis]
MLKEIAGQRIWTTEDGQGAPRLFLHCSLGQSESLFSLAGALPPARNLFFDLPGHGKSGPWRGEDLHKDVFDVAEALLQGPTHVVGHSFGGTVALRLAVERPDLVSRLTLIDPVFFAAARRGAEDAEAHSAYKVASPAFIDAWEAGDLEAASKAFLAQWGTGRPWDAMSQATRERIMGQIHLIAAAVPVLENDAPGLLDRLDRVTCPVDLIEGGASDPVMSKIVAALAVDLPQAGHHVIEGAGHMVAVTHPQEVAAAMAGRGTVISA